MSLRLPRTYQDVAEKFDNATFFRRAMNLWPPMLFAGIRITELGEDFRTATVVLRKHRLTSNYVGTQYGGSLYSMTDPFWMLMVIHNLGPEYVVWDKAAEIDFVSPGRTEVSTDFELTEAQLDEIRSATADGAKHLIWFTNELRGTDGELVATVRKQVYVRRRRQP